ncbi:MAG: translation initiation factor IF-2 [Chlamydiales bacterium]|nr:translation initiation factor IF-2 [Chlamydiales bacterium]
MAKNLKAHIKNVQIAGAINLNSLKAKLSKKKEGDEPIVEATAISEEVSKEPEKKKRKPAAIVDAKPEVSVQADTPQPKAQVAKAAEKKPASVAKAKDAEAVIESKPEAKPAAPPENEKTTTPNTYAKSAPAADKVKLGPVFREVPKVAPKPVTPPAAPAAASSTPTTPAKSAASPPSVQRPYQPPASRPAGQWRSVAPQRFIPPAPRPDGPPEPRLGPVERQPLPPSAPPTAPREDIRPDSRDSGPMRDSRDSGYRQSGGYQGSSPRTGGYQGNSPRPGGYQGGAPRTGGYQGNSPRPSGYQGNSPRLGGYQGSGPRTGGYQGQDRRTTPQPFGTRPQPVPQAKPDARVVPEKKEFTNKEIEDSLFRRNKTKAKDAPAKPLRKIDTKEFENRIRHGLRGDEEEDGWRKRRPSKNMRMNEEQEVVRPTKISVRIPISVKDLASEMKLKASQLIAKLFLQGKILTLNDMLEDELVIQLLGHDFGCEVLIDTREEERIRITDKSLRDEIAASNEDELVIRPPVVTFMGHVDHGKTSLIDTIRKSNTASQEVGAITQHIGAFRVSTPQGDIAVLDTPGHEAFSHMRERGAEVTDIVVLVIAGDEGIKMQTDEALSQAKASKATIVVALNKCDKPAFNAENVYRQLAERELLPEAWGGQTITVNTSATTGEGIPELLEMLALQAEVLELRANPKSRARGTVIESEVEKGMGPVATVLVQNGTLRVGDSLVFGFNWARVKTMKDEKGRDIEEAGPSTPVRINGLSGVPESGEEFIVVKNEKEAREISQVRHEGKRVTTFHAKRRGSLESMIEQAQEGAPKKLLNIIIRADVQGSAEALKNALMKIDSKKVEANILSWGVGMISESDVQLAVASKATIIGFHTQMESHVESEIKELGVQVRLHDIIYHAIDDIKAMMLALLDKIVQEKDVGKAEVKATFKSSQLGVIAGCQVSEGTITRGSQMRVMREGKSIFKGPISSLKRNKDDVREVGKGAECGILIQGFSDYQVGDILEAFEIIYLTQEL